MRLSRRTFLKGLGASMALPWLEAMGQTTAPAKRLLIIYDGTGGAPRNPRFPNAFYPSTEGTGFEMTDILSPLSRWRERMLVLGGIDNLASWKGPLRSAIGGGHTSAQMCNFSGMPYGGQTLDQLIASKVGTGTRLPYLSYCTGYKIIPFWQSQDVQAPFEGDPCTVFEKMFGRRPTDPAPTTVSHATENRRSVVDAVARSSAQLKAKLGKTDRGTLDAYLESVRSVERRMSSVPTRTCQVPTTVNCTNDETVNFEYFKLVALALACDITRVATITLNNEPNRMPMFDFPAESWHDDVEHRAHDTDAKTAAVIRWQSWIMEQVGLIADQLASTPEGFGSVLDNTLIVVTNELAHADYHNHDDMPYVLLGGRSFDSSFRFGRYARLPGTSNNQLFASIHNAIVPGAPITQFGDPAYGAGVMTGLI